MSFNPVLALFLRVIDVAPLPGLYHVTYPRSSLVSGEIASSSSPRLARLRGGSRLSPTHPREAGAQCPRSSKGSSNRGDPGFDRARPLRPCVILGNSDQAGTDVTVNGAGSINTSAFSFVINGTNFSPFIQPTMGTILLGQTGPNNVSIYGGISGPSSFGAGPQSLPSSGSGPIVGVQHIGMTGLLILPNGYLSGVTLGTSIDTYTNVTIASLGLNPGNYVWEWGAGASHDTFTLEIAAPVPEPASLMPLALPLGISLLAVKFRSAKRKGA
jgi:hypothetical protein